jgi:hypothetical protein
MTQYSANDLARRRCLGQDNAADPRQLYRNPIIVDILKKTIFTGSKSLPNLFPDHLTLTDDGHIQMPAPLVAIAATLVSHLTL